MRILKDVFLELVGMSAGDARLSAAVLIVVAASAGLIDVFGVASLAGGGLLLFGCLTLVIESVRREARRMEPILEDMV